MPRGHNSLLPGHREPDLAHAAHRPRCPIRWAKPTRMEPYRVLCRWSPPRAVSWHFRAIRSAHAPAHPRFTRERSQVRNPPRPSEAVDSTRFDVVRQRTGLQDRRRGRRAARRRPQAQRRRARHARRGNVRIAATRRSPRSGSGRVSASPSGRAVQWAADWVSAGPSGSGGAAAFTPRARRAAWMPDATTTNMPAPG